MRTVLLVSLLILVKAASAIEVTELIEKHELHLQQLVEFEADLEMFARAPGDNSRILSANWKKNAQYERVRRIGNLRQENYLTDCLVGDGRKKFYHFPDKDDEFDVERHSQKSGRASDFADDGQHVGNMVSFARILHLKFASHIHPMNLCSLRSFVGSAETSSVRGDGGDFVLELSFKTQDMPTKVSMRFSPRYAYAVTDSVHYFPNTEFTSGVTGLEVHNSLSNFEEVMSGIWFPKLATTTLFTGADRTVAYRDELVVERFSLDAGDEDRLGFKFPPNLVIDKTTANGRAKVYFDENGSESDEFESTVEAMGIGVAPETEPSGNKSYGHFLICAFVGAIAFLVFRIVYVRKK